MTVQTFREWVNQAGHPWANIAKQKGFEFNSDHRMAGALAQTFSKGDAELQLISSSSGHHRFILSPRPGAPAIEGDSEPKLNQALLRY